MLHFPCDIYFCISLNLDAIFFLNTVHFKTKNLSLVSRFTDRGINPPAYILSVPRTFCPSPIHFVPLLYILSLPHTFCPSLIHLARSCIIQLFDCQFSQTHIVTVCIQKLPVTNPCVIAPEMLHVWQER